MATAFRALLGAGLLLVLTGAMMSAQDKGQGTAGPDSRLIRLNVTATTKEGQPVSDLKAGEIEIRENGRPQKLSSFQAALAGGSRGYIVFAVDESTTEREDRLAALKSIGEWIDKRKAESDQVALISLGESVRVWRLFTSDKRLLLPKLEEMKAQAGSGNDDVMIGGFMSTLRDCRNGQQAESCGAAAVDAFKNEQENLARRRKAVLWSLVKMLEPFPGEKRVIYCTNGFSMNAGAWAADAFQQVFRSLGAPSTVYNSSVTSRSNTVDNLREVTSAAMRANVTFYTVYGRARSETRRDAVFQPWLDPSVADSLSAARRRDTADALSALGNDTGGRAYLGSADVLDATQRAIGEMAGTFYATYTPDDNEFDGRYRKIEIHTTRPNVVARTRAGYFAIASKALGILATTSAPQLQGTRYSVPILVQLDPTELAWTGPAGKRTDQLAVVMSVLNARKELLSTNVLNLELAEPKTKLAEINLNAGLGPGQYFCILMVTESATTNSAATSVVINLPPPGAK